MLESVESGDRFVVDTVDDADEWNSFVERADGPVYARRGWSEAVRSYGHPVWHLAARDQDTGEIVAALPLYHVDSRIFGSQLLSPAFAERGSVIVADRDDAAAGAQLLFDHTVRIADELDVDVASLRGSEMTPPDEFSVENRYVTFQADVGQGRESMWADIKDSRQRQINQAADNPALEFAVGDSLDDLRTYYRLYLQTMRGHGSPPHSFEFFRILWDRFHDDGCLRLSMITRDGSLINGMIDLSLGSTVYQWGVVSDYEQRELNGGSWILWKSLQWAAEKGYRTYEFGRTREGSGVYMFKKSFGGSKTWYDDLHYFPGETTTLPDPEDDTYDLPRRVWQRLPIAVTRAIGPHIRKQTGI